MTVVVGTTLAAFAMDQEDTWGAWLYGAEELRERSPELVHHFAALQVDARGLEPFAPLVERLEALEGGYWTYMLDDGRERVTTENRLRHITMGQNLVTDYCSSPGVTHLLFMAADCQPDPDSIRKMLEVDHGVVGGHVPTYGLRGMPVMETSSPFEPAHLKYPPEWDVQEHMPTAAYVMIRRDVFKRLRWRWDIDEGMSDDPAYHYDAKTLLGVDAYVRHDVLGKHYPECIGAVETRGHDMKVHR